MKSMILLLFWCCAALLNAQDAAKAVEDTITLPAEEAVEDTVTFKPRIAAGAQVGVVSSADADNIAAMAGLLLQVKFAETMGGELSVNFRSEDYADGLVSVNSMPILLSFLYYPIEPVYAIIGFGIYSVSLDYPDYTIGGTTISDETETDFDFHFGLGASFPFAQLFRITAAIRYHFLGYDLKAIEQVREATTVNANYLSIMGGFLFEF